MMAQCFEYGAKKYGRWNYKQGIEYTRLADATVRYTYQWLHYKDIDEEGGLNHIGHALANLAMLVYVVSWMIESSKKD